MTFNNRFPIILLLTISCLIIVSGVVYFARQPHTPTVPNLILMAESNDVESFLQLSSRQAGLAITLKPALPGQWQIMIQESPEDALSRWLDHIAVEGINIQSIQVLNTEKAGMVRVPVLTLIASTKLH